MDVLMHDGFALEVSELTCRGVVKSRSAQSCCCDASFAIGRMG